MNTWIDSAFVYSKSTSNEELLDGNDICKFAYQIDTSIGLSLKNLNLNIFEYAALRAICIWNLKFYETSPKMKSLALEHYKGITGALRQYYEVRATTNM